MSSKAKSLPKKTPPKWADVYPQGTREGDEEQKFFVALARDKDHEWRSVSGIRKATGLKEKRIEEIIQKYDKAGMIFNSPTNPDMWGYWERVPQMLEPDKTSISKSDQNKRIDKALGIMHPSSNPPVKKKGLSKKSGIKDAVILKGGDDDSLFSRSNGSPVIVAEIDENDDGEIGLATLLVAAAQSFDNLADVTDSRFISFGLKKPTSHPQPPDDADAGEHAVDGDPKDSGDSDDSDDSSTPDTDDNVEPKQDEPDAPAHLDKDDEPNQDDKEDAVQNSKVVLMVATPKEAAAINAAVGQRGNPNRKVVSNTSASPTPTRKAFPSEKPIRYY